MSQDPAHRGVTLPSQTIEIGAADIYALAWPGSQQQVRIVRIAGRAWFVAADLCRALDFAMSANGGPNVAQALKPLDAEDRGWARLEVEPGTFKPFSRLALTSAPGVVQLVAKKRRLAADTALARRNCTFGSPRRPGSSP